MASEQDAYQRLVSALADRYRIEDEIGSGGMATVYLAEDLKHNRKVALKVLKPDVADAVGSKRFLREIEVAANLSHPHILPLYDSGEADGFLYFVMPHVRGGSLRDRLRAEGQLPVEEAVTLASEVADALAFAHERGIVHRDVKPANILLTGGHALLADFGVAQAVAEAGDERLTQTGLSLGSPAYMSPEQATGERDVDGRSDLYALGCVLYEMLAGHPPFAGSQVESVIRQHLTADPPPVTQVRTAVPTEVAGALARALAKSPADRYRTATDFGKALSAAGPREGKAQGSRRPWSLATLLATAVAVLAVGLLVWIVLMSPGLGPAGAVSDRVIVLPYDNQTGDPDLEPLGRMVAEWITEGLARTGEVQVVPNLMVLESLARLQQEIGAGTEPPVRELADATDAGIAVTGSYYRHGEDFEVHSEVVDLVSRASLGAIEPVRGPVGDPGPAIESVRDRVMGVLATRLRRGTAWEVPASVQPPTYEAFQQYARGNELWVQGRYADAAEAYLQAYEADTTFLRSLLIAAGAFANAGNRQLVDSLFGVIVPRREELAPYDRYRLDYGMAGERGDLPAQLRAARSAVELVPFGTLRLALVGVLVGSNRPVEGLQSYEEVWEDFLAVGREWYRLWDSHTEIHHVLGNHERELELARQGRGYLPSSLHLMAYEGRALAALGRTEELRLLVEQVLATSEGLRVTPASVLREVAQESKAHGHGVLAARLIDQALTWLESAPPEFANGPAGQELLGSLLYLDERWEEAGEVFRRLRDTGTVDPTVLGFLGAVAARLGDANSADRYSGELEDQEGPYQRGANTLWRARIEAILGNRDEAVSLLRRAHSEGVGFGIWLHRDMDLALLRGFPPFEEFLRPKG
jgi:tetratricopeptide (TPR) repeat protein/TolB-like protein